MTRMIDKNISGLIKKKKNSYQTCQIGNLDKDFKPAN